MVLEDLCQEHWDNVQIPSFHAFTLEDQRKGPWGCSPRVLEALEEALIISELCACCTLPYGQTRHSMMNL